MTNEPMGNETKEEAIGDNTVHLSPQEVAEARVNIAIEHDTSTWVAVRKFHKALLFCIFFGISAILWGFDMQVNGGLLASPEFRRVFGYTKPDGTTILPASWQAAFNTVSIVGGMFGTLFCGVISPYFGRRFTLGLACVISIGSIFLQFFAFSPGVLLAGKLINGFALGMYLVTASSYSAETCPVALRGITIAMVNFFVVIGQLLGNCLIKAFGSRSDSYAYRIPFAFQWLFPVILLAGIWFVPESPYWLVQRRKYEEARKVLQRLQVNANIDPWLAQIKETVRFEEEVAGKASYVECFKNTDLRRTMIAIVIWTANSFSGVNFVLGYSTYFFEIAGLPTSESFNMGVGVTALGVVGNICSWFVINTVGRRALVPGLISMTVILFIIGILDVVPNYNSKVAWAQSSFIIIWNFIFDLSLGPLEYVISAEIPSTRLRSHAVSISFFFQNFWSLIFTIVIPYMLNPDEGNLRGKTGFIFGGCSIISCIWAYFCLPETKGRTFEELDHLFEQKVPARQFSTNQIAELQTSP